MDVSGLYSQLSAIKAPILTRDSVRYNFNVLYKKLAVYGFESVIAIIAMCIICVADLPTSLDLVSLV